MSRKGARMFWLTTLTAVMAALCHPLILRSCTTVWACLATSADLGSANNAMALFFVCSTTLLWSSRSFWLLIATRRALHGLHRESWPPDLAVAADRSRIECLEYLSSSVPMAFCAGVIWPTVFVSRGLVESLNPGELDAVLAHEKCHSDHRDPLRHALLCAAADTLFYLPIVRWWVDRQSEKAELRADRVALQRVGHRQLAGALWVVGCGSAVQGAAAFAGATQVRVAQVLGDPLPRRYPTVSSALLSASGLLVVLDLASCLSDALMLLR